MNNKGFTASELRTFKNDSRNIDTPFKVVAQGIGQPQRFETEKEARKFFNAHQGRALLSYNQNYSYRILAYKHT